MKSAAVAPRPRKICALIASLLAFMVVALSMGQVVTAVPASEAVESVEPTTALRMSTPAAVGATQTDGQEFCNTAPTTVTFMPSGVVATPYPSTITVNGADAVTSLVTVRLAGVSHTRPRDLDVMLVSPNGQNLVLMSDTGGGSGTPTSADLTFSDTASGSVPDDVRLFTGTFLPTNVGSDDVWPAPAPAASSATTLDTFIGANPNGVWSLFVVDDTEVDSGRIGSWCLTISSDALPATRTAVTSSPNPSRPGADVTVTATVTSGPNPVSAGSVTFSDGATTLAADVPVNAQGKAAFTTDALTLGNHAISATFNGSGMLTSSASVTQFVTTRVEGTFCTNSSIAVPGSNTIGAAAPYPSTIDVTGAGAFTGQVSVQLVDVTHTYPRDLDILLVSPTGENLVLMSDVGVSPQNGPATLTFSDSAVGEVDFSTALTTGTYRPTNGNSSGSADRWPAPAPTPSSATTLATFTNQNPNGAWRLFVNDGDVQNVGTIGGGWCLKITSDEVAFEATTTAVTSSANPSRAGAEVTFTATVTSDGSPVTSGTVTFNNWDTPLAVDVPVDDQGQATFTTNALAESSHFIVARYSGGTGFFASAGGVDQRIATFAGGMWCNNDPISVPGSGADGRADRYPSQITVAGAGASTAQVTVQLGSVIHGFTKDLDVLLVSPTGENLVLMSDVGGFRLPATVTFADGAPPIPEFNALESTTYRPTNAGPGDSWPAPAPTASDATGLATFNGTNPNGVWSLYVHDDFTTSGGGSIGGGWCLTITGATTTALTSSPNPSLGGDDVTFAADVTSNGAPVTTGTVTFKNGTTTLAADVPVVDGQATFSTRALAPGRHEITATFNGAPGLATSAASVTQVVDTATTTPAEGTWCNDGSIAVPGSGTSGSADPYPSRIKVSGAAPYTSDVTVELRRFRHEFPVDVDVMLVGPGGENLILMSDTGFDDTVGGAPVTVTFSDGAAGPIPGFERLATGTYAPSNAGSDPDSWPEPAPPASGATRLATFYRTNPNGDWRLFVVDDANTDTGSIDGGWCLTVASTELPSTVTTLTASANPSLAGEDVTFTAKVTGGDEPVTDGTVTIVDATTNSTLATGLELDTDGETSVTVDDLSVGDHEIIATYSGTTEFGPSDDALTHDVRVGTTTVLASTPDRSVVGDSVTFTASVTSGADAVTAGTVTFTDHTTATELFAADLDPGGRVSFAIDTLSVGDHEVIASYSGTTQLAASADTLTHTVDFAETVALESTPNPSAPGEDVTFSAIVTKNDQPVTHGSITFSEGDATLAEATVDGEGRASFTTNALARGGHLVTATFDAGTGLPGNFASITHFVDAPTTTPTDGTWCNAGPIGVNEGEATPYPSVITVSDVAAVTSQAKVELSGVNLELPFALQVLLVSPTGENLILMAGAGGFSAVTDVNLTFSDAAPDLIMDELTSGDHLPTNFGDLFGGDRLPDPAPPPSEATALSTFDGQNPNGVWRLYVASLLFGDVGTPAGSIDGGWCLTIRSAQPSIITLDSTPSPSRLGQAVSLTAMVEGEAGGALTDGTVTFRRGTEALGTVDVDEGRATFTTSDLTPGTHSITATYNGTRAFAQSTSAPLLHLVDASGPEARPTTSPAPNAAGWHNGDVTVSWNWLDVDSDIDPARCTGRSTTEGQGAITVTATCADRAGNQSTASHAVRVDSIAPTVTISSPAPRSYWRGAEVMADYGCSDRRSGVAVCTGPVADGMRLDTSTPGSHRFTVTARDRAGNLHTTTVNYSVVELPRCHGRTATIVGAAGNDVITGTPGDDVIVTGGGQDWVRASAGDDTICTGGARDIVVAGSGDDIVDTGDGRDGGHGGTGDDIVTGGPNGDILTGGLGADTLRGNAGKDNLIGHNGNDSLDGGSDSDSCRGGTGTDQQAACEATLGIP